MHPRVVHCKVSDCDVYVGRPSKWGNPFSIGRDGDRRAVIELYKEWLLMGDGQFLLPEIKTLKGKTLGSYCYPNASHPEVLAQLADSSYIMSTNPTITALSDALAKSINPNSMGLERSKSHWLCNLCNKPASIFRDKLSAREYKISGMCQACQDSTFGV